MIPEQIKGIFKTISSPINILTDTNPARNFLSSIKHAFVKPNQIKPLTSHRYSTTLPDTTDSTKEFDLQCLAADFYLTVYNIDTTQQNSPINYTTSPNHPRNCGLGEHKAFFESQTKTKDRYYTPKPPTTIINDITFVRYAESLYTHYSRTARYFELSTCYFQSFPMPTPFPISSQCTPFLNGLARNSHNP